MDSYCNYILERGPKYDQIPSLMLLVENMLVLRLALPVAKILSLVFVFYRGMSQLVNLYYP